jgi:hypothetical protein
MFRCRSCRCRIRDSQNISGARCPKCLEPLYERPRVPELTTAGEDANAGVCAVHPQSLSVATCRRCGNYMCPVCWTRWREQAICTACVERALESREAAPEAARRHLRQAILALVFGIAAWGLLGLCMLLVLLIFSEEANLGVMLGILGIVLFASPFVGALGIGQGAAAIRTRGDHMILATSGLLLSALQAGTILGLFVIRIWND